MKTNVNRILVGLDGSVEALAAFDKAVELAILHHAELIIAHVIDLREFSSAAAFDSIWADDHYKGAQKFLDDFVQEAKDAGVENVRSILETDSAKVFLGKVLPERENIDLMVMGAVGMSRLERILVGSVAEYVIAHSNCDVYIVHPEKKKA